MYKQLIDYLDYILYPEGTVSSTVSYIDKDGVTWYVSLECLQKQFEKLLASIPRE